MNKFVSSDFICPICNFSLRIDNCEERTTTECPNCSSKVIPAPKSSNRTAGEDFADIKSAPALLAFVNTYFDDRLDDDFFNSPSTFTSRFVDATVKNALLYTANDPIAWKAEFERLLLPLEKKLCYIEKLPKKIAKEHLADNLGEQTYLFDVYESSLKYLAPYIEAIKSSISLAIERAEKYGIDKSDAKQMQERFDAFELRVKELCQKDLPGDPTELEAVKQARSQRDAKINEALMAMGVSAEDTYISANSLVKKHKNAQALDMFRQLGAYKDSLDQITELNCYKKFDDIRSIAGKLYLTKKNQSFVFPKNAEKVPLYDLIPLNEQNPDLVAIDTPTHKIVATYADKIYHLNKDKQLTCLDLQDNINRLVLLDGKTYLFDATSKFYSFDDLCKLVVASREKVVIEKGRHKGKLRHTDTDLLLIDLSSEEMTLCDFGICDIVCTCNNYVFYTKKNPAVAGSPKQLIGYNVITGKKVILPQNVYKIHAVIDEYIIYTVLKSSPYNLSLRAFSCGVTSFERVLEDNVLDFSAVIDKKVYFSVGSYDMRVLCRIDPTTLERNEIQRGIKAKSGSEILITKDGWIYFKKGEGLNTALARCRTDGSDFSVICAGFERFAGSTPFIRGYIYYIDTNNSLCRVLISGHSFQLISDNIVKDLGILCVHNEKICFARNEYVGKCALVSNASSKRAPKAIVQTDKYSLSLYTCNFDGSDLQKICFDIDHVWQLCRNSLLIKRIDTQRYIAKNKRAFVENTTTYYDVIDLCNPSKINPLVSFKEPDFTKNIPKGSTPVSLCEQAKAEKLPPIK